MLLLSDGLLGRFRASAYSFIIVLIYIRNVWISFQQYIKSLIWEAASRSPFCRKVLVPLLRQSGREHTGTNPELPSSLAFVFCQTLHDSKAGGDLEHVAALINWCMRQQAQHVFLYDPRGWLQRRAKLLEKVLEKAQKRTAPGNLRQGSDRAGCSSRREAVFHVGWPEGEQWLVGGGVSNSAWDSRGREAEVWLHNAEAPQSGEQQQQQQQQQQQYAAVPGRASLSKSAARGGQGQGGDGQTEGKGAARRRFPLWPMSTLGRGETVQAAAWEQAVPLTVVVLSAADAYWPLEQASRGWGGAGREGAVCAGGHGVGRNGSKAGANGVAEKGLEGQAAVQQGEGTEGAGEAQAVAEEARSWQEAGEALEGSGEDVATLERAIGAPRRLQQRLMGVAGPLAGVEPDLVIVLGEALTLAGYPPWALRTSEMHHAGMVADLRESDLDQILRRYLRTKQRFGA